jgi:predicted sugar kinase
MKHLRLSVGVKDRKMALTLTVDGCSRHAVMQVEGVHEDRYLSTVITIRADQRQYPLSWRGIIPGQWTVVVTLMDVDNRVSDKIERSVFAA